MDKQKQIDEMAYIIYKYGQTYDDCVEGAEYNLAKYLINAGYRKIPENAVVLTREEYDGKSIIVEMSGGHKLKLSVGKFGEMSKILEEHTRKEMAEKFAERLKEFLDGNHCCGFILEQSVEYWNYHIDEICKEITEGNDDDKRTISSQRETCT